MSSPDGKRCEDCFYWDEKPSESSAPGERVGLCHRFPPHPMVVPSKTGVVGRFPRTINRGWCGEWLTNVREEVIAEVVTWATEGER